MWPAARETRESSTQRGDVHHDGGRTYFDVPPSWDGKAPDRNLEAYVKAAEAWVRTTKAQPKQRGVQLMAAATGELRQVMASVELDDLTGEDGAEKLLKTVKEEYAWSLSRSLPLKLEAALYSQGCRRQAGESLVSFTAKKLALFKELERAGCSLPDVCKGLILCRDASLPKADVDAVHYWLKGDYQLSAVLEAVRRLDRPMTSGSQVSSGPKVYALEEEGVEEAGWDIENEYGQPWSQPWSETTEAWQEEEGLSEFLGDIDEETPLEEETVQTVMAVYPAVREALKRDLLTRGFAPPLAQNKGKGKPRSLKVGAKGKGKEAAQFPQSSRLQALISRTRCAKCGLIGHWARTCKAGNGDRARTGPGSSSGGEKGYSNFFISATASHSFPCGHELFIGLSVCVGRAIVDTGAQASVCGRKAYEEVVTLLKKEGLQSVEVSMSGGDQLTKGVGGQAVVLKKVEIPICIAGVSGLLAVLILDSDIPLLLHVGLLQRLGAVVHLPKHRIIWTKLKRSSAILTEQSGHLSMDVFLFPKKGWKPPSSTTCVLYDVLEPQPSGSMDQTWATFQPEGLHVGSQSSTGDQWQEECEDRRTASSSTSSSTQTLAMDQIGKEGFVFPRVGCQDRYGHDCSSHANNQGCSGRGPAGCERQGDHDPSSSHEDCQRRGAIGSPYLLPKAVWAPRTLISVLTRTICSGPERTRTSNGGPAWDVEAGGEEKSTSSKPLMHQTSSQLVATEDSKYQDVPHSYRMWAIREYEEAGDGMAPALQRFCGWAVEQERRSISLAWTTRDLSPQSSSWKAVSESSKEVSKELEVKKEPMESTLVELDGSSQTQVNGFP